eukprot:636888-Prorocentrum_minimum.AAC.1
MAETCVRGALSRSMKATAVLLFFFAAAALPLLAEAREGERIAINTHNTLPRPFISRKLQQEAVATSSEEGSLTAVSVTAVSADGNMTGDNNNGGGGNGNGDNNNNNGG